MPMLALGAVIGQPAVTRLLTRLVARDRLPHAVLLEGVPGCGRRTTATALAKALLCRARREGDACGTCAACVQCDQGTHPDLALLPHDTDEDDYSVDLIRERVVAAAYESPLLGDTRAFVLPGVERLQAQAANALLKVIEEPPPGTYVIMTATQAAAVLPTIRSRAQTFRLQPLASDDVARVLVARGLDPGAARLRAAGSVGSHRGLLEEDAAPPLDDLLRLCQDGFDSGVIGALVARLPNREAREGGRTVAGEQRRVCRRWLDALAQALRARLRDADAERSAVAIERVLQAQRDLQRNLAPRIVLEGIALGAR